MKGDTIQAKNIDDFIAQYPKDVQATLQKLRTTIHKAAPQAEEAIKYGIPTFTLNGNLIHFSAYENHIGVYPSPTGIAKFKKELAPYEAGKGTLRFPIDKALPLALIANIVKFLVLRNQEKAKAKAKKKK